MYNEKIKKQFINASSQESKGQVAALFRKSYVFEHSLEKDLAQFAEHELQEFFESPLFENVQKRSMATYKSKIRAYINWAKENTDFTVQDSEKEDELKIARNKRYISNIYANPLDLENEMNKIFEPKSEGRDVVYRAYVWLLYTGLTEDEIENLNKNNVDLKEMKIKINNKEYDIYPEALHDIRASVEQKYFKRYRVDGSVLRIERVDNNKVMSTEYVGGLTYKSLITKWGAKKKENELAGIATKGIVKNGFILSGVFYRTLMYEAVFREKEAIKGIITFFLKKANIEPSEKSSGFMRELVKNYKDWKRTYYI